MKQSIWSVAGLGLVLMVGMLCAPLRAAEATKEGIEYFEKNIRPVLSENCYKCHSTEAKANKKLKAKFFADSLEGLTNGGDSGDPGIVPGNLEKGTVLKAIHYAYKGDDESLNMPPKNKKDGTGGKLPDDVIKRFDEWVKMGAPVPADFEKPKEPKADAGQPGAGSSSAVAGAATHPSADAKIHWAFVLPVLPPVPQPKVNGWAQNEIDRFVQAKLEAQGLEPAAQADRHTLIRRATFDLIGLPPTPEEVKAFIADKSPDAYEKVIDRLLADPRYGEKWARHWLDVARYADTKGYVFQEERRYPYAYTYRDYVIKAFNDDKPYDLFLIEQIAADQLDLKGDHGPLAAMGFLTVGRRFLNNIHDIIDDRIDVVCRGTMGLTVGCARCHDHKFDPIPTRDYYSLHGVFASSIEPNPLPLLGDNQGSPEYEKELAKRQAAVDVFLTTKSAAVLAGARTPRALGNYLAATLAKDSGQEAGADLSRFLTTRWRQRLARAAQQKDAIFTAWRLYAAIPAADFEAKAPAVTEQLAKPTAGQAINPLVAQAFAATPKSMAEVAERYGALLSKFDKPDPLPDANEEAVRLVLSDAQSPFSIPRPELSQLLKRDARDELTKLQTNLDAWPATSMEAPPRAMVLNDDPHPHDSHVLMRGNPGSQGVAAPREFLECLTQGDPKPFIHGSGRLEFAEAIASKSNPLTARVFVNRMWGWHFGQPMVKTPSDFGTRSDPPTHPELLDWLAVTFENDGWSIKKLQKRIMLSATYRQSSDDNAQARAVDPENRLLWRMNRSRLDFESTRDALLFVSGHLNNARFGRSTDIANPDETRRTIYGMVDRQNLPSIYRSFDFASPDASSPQRFITTVPQQALFFMNSPFAQLQAKFLLDRPEVKSDTQFAEKVTQIYQLLYGRNPLPAEIGLAHAFIEGEGKGAALTAAIPPAPIWEYGYGRFDNASGKVIGFTIFPYHDKSVWQGGRKLPDAKLHFASLTARGGHPGLAGHAVVRRWTSPGPGTLSVDGTLDHPSEGGDGILAYVVSSRRGVIGSWRVHHEKVQTEAKGIAVLAGETIDFIVDSGPTDTSDSFSWAPKLRLDGAKASGGAITTFDAAQDFAELQDAAPLAKQTPWEKYVQVLLESNEFVFVD